MTIEEGQVELIQATLSVVQEQLSGLQAARPQRLARGTRDLTRQSGVVVAKIARDSLAARVEHALRHETLTGAQVAKATGGTLEEVQAILDAAIRTGKLYNVSSSQYPIWTWRVGDKTPLPELINLVRRLISERPMTTQQLADATGARFSRVGGAIVELQREEALRRRGAPDSPERFLNLGAPKVGKSSRAGTWFLIPDTARSAALEPKGKKV